jgi:hypothetical protein
MRLIAALGFAASLVCVSPAAPCTIVRSAQPTAIDLIQRADVIVVAVARDLHPASPGLIQFEVRETLKGNAGMPFLWIRGRFIDRDDFNGLKVPLNGVRPDGYGGSCYASDYRRGAAYLLVLRRTATELSPYWSPLSRVNDQIRPNGDPWLDWVRRQTSFSR